MLAAILTTLLFAMSGVTGPVVARRLGAQWGNGIRLAIAGLVLGIISLIWFSESFHPSIFSWFFFSGIIGFGVGDVALYAAYAKLGSRLTILLALCLAPIFALIMEWAWLGNLPSAKILICVFVILVGVGLAVMSRGRKVTVSTERDVGGFGWGIVAAIVAAFGQGTGAVISRKAEAISSELGIEVHGVSAAFQRILAGVLVAAIVVFILRFIKRNIRIPDFREHWKVSGWLLGAALFGPALGVSCFQWALQSLESAVVLAIVALTPVVMIPMAIIVEKDRPGLLAILGALIAVSGAVAMHVW